MSKQRSKFPLLRRYILRWAKELNLLHLTWIFDQVEEDFNGIGDRVIASVHCREFQNSINVSVYPIAHEQDDDTLWRVACHEALHVATHRYVDFARRHMPDHGTIVQEEEQRLEQVIDALSKQLVKLLPRTSVYPIISSKVDPIVWKAPSVKWRGVSKSKDEPEDELNNAA